jgi:hypothetical protein
MQVSPPSSPATWAIKRGKLAPLGRRAVRDLLCEGRSAAR